MQRYRRHAHYLLRALTHHDGCDPHGHAYGWNLNANRLVDALKELQETSGGCFRFVIKDAKTIHTNLDSSNLETPTFGKLANAPTIIERHDGLGGSMFWLAVKDGGASRYIAFCKERDRHNFQQADVVGFLGDMVTTAVTTAPRRAHPLRRALSVLTA